MLTEVVVDPKILDASIRLACERAIAAEPKLTQWDMVMGDGDCGEAVKGVSEGMSATLVRPMRANRILEYSNP